MGCKLFTGIFTFHWSGAVKHFVITMSVNQTLTTNNKFQAANRFGKMTGYLINRYTLTLWKNKNVYAKVTRNCRWPETVEFTVYIVFGMTRSGIEPTLFRSRDERSTNESPLRSIFCYMLSINLNTSDSGLHHTIARSPIRRNWPSSSDWLRIRIIWIIAIYLTLFFDVELSQCFSPIQ